MTGTDLFLVGGFEEIAMTFKAGFVLKVRWFDYRLKFINLRETNNFIEGGQDDVIWIPMLSFATSVTSLYLQNDPFSTIAIEKKGNIFISFGIWIFLPSILAAKFKSYTITTQFFSLGLHAD